MAKPVALLMRDPDLFKKHVASLPKDFWTREIGGAWVEFGDGAGVTKVILLSDFSAIQMRNLPSRSSARSVQELLADVGISVSISDINFIKLVKNRNGMAIVKVEDPEVAKPASFEAYYKLKNQQLNIGGLPVVAQMPAAVDATEKDGPWQMELEGLVATIPPEDIMDIFPPPGAPYQVEMGDPSYDTDSDIDSTMIKSLLYDAQARFIEESEALDAVSQLNEMWLPFNPSGKLYLQHVHLVKFRVSSRVYCVVEDSIESLRKDWERQFVYFSMAPERGYRVLKLESQDRGPFTQAKEALEHIINGKTMTLNGKNLWSPYFKADRGTYRRLQDIEQDLGVVIIRDIKSSKFRVFVPEDKFVLACEALD
ncbi:hypothetical protein LZL87_009701 [Fusarium oxysporum]|nr:hypothetical protein LZL87_009701 [Fusarium oxysporum]